jgi:hypothetical protein
MPRRSPTRPDPVLAAAIRDAILRATAVVGLPGVALIHLLDAPSPARAATALTEAVAR